MLRAELLLQRNQLRALEHLARKLPGDLSGGVWRHVTTPGSPDMTCCRAYKSHLVQRRRWSLGRPTARFAPLTPARVGDTSEDKTKAEMLVLASSALIRNADI